MEPWKSEETLREYYHTRGHTLAELGDMWGCNHNNIVYWMDKFGIERRKRGEPTGLPAFRTSEQGYEYWQTQHRGEVSKVYVHRLAAVAWFGLDAVVNNDIHHDPPIPWLNTEEAVSPIPHGQHMRIHNYEQDYSYLERMERDERGRFVS